MGEVTGIEWCDKTWSPWFGCTKVSAACDHCYAEAWAKRTGIVKWGNEPRRLASPGYWKRPVKWNRDAEKSGDRPRIFPSLCDPFDNQVDPQWRSELFQLIEDTPHLIWTLLTKRPQNVTKMIWPKWDAGLPRNIWLGATVESRSELKRVFHLREVPAAVRFLSCEPLLEALGPLYLGGIHWVITGGESGPKRRPMDLAWMRDIRDQCAGAGVAFFGKQDDKVRELPADLLVRQLPHA